ncbi:TetR/AcrR family transcriptional regulator [Streptomyces sp. SL13]|uniref:TetR/AcrR family transcriptional regulator n=1 Tax=Streptantibioticus silvisoli TaxID=2705255 RepID=A0AA90H8G7_9ACTN|nr:TetR/AcrR family transcriptional regulator [Streptantibioticus silvisoli]MDI5970760.1 TetR/AcrR family transcriptional regulator [Streptantibioticus silvisoli]
MAGEVRRQMIEGAVQLLARRGLQGTSFSEVLELTGAPRGSVYHHFPGGKDELVGAAVDTAVAQVVAFLDRKEGAPAVEVAEHFFAAWRLLLTRSGFQAGCALVAVAVATDSQELLDRTAAAFDAWRLRLAELLERGGLPPAAATSFAAVLLAASEGAVVICRARRSLEPFEKVTAHLLDQIRAASNGTG